MSPPPATPKDAARQAREKRLAEALRANLKRRKAAAKEAATKPSAAGKAPGSRP